jgi:hypothetical protein
MITAELGSKQKRKAAEHADNTAIDTNEKFSKKEKQQGQRGWYKLPVIETVSFR